MPEGLQLLFVLGVMLIGVGLILAVGAGLVAAGSEKPGNAYTVLGVGLVIIAIGACCGYFAT